MDMDQSTRRSFIQFSLIEALYFGIFAITSYQTIFLQGEGLSSAQIGLIVSVASIVGLIASPIWGIIGDTMHSARVPFLISITVVTLMLAVMPILGRNASRGMLFFLIYIPVVFIFKQASNAMLDAWCIGALAPKGIGYGSARMWGSIGYSLVSLLMGGVVGIYLSVGAAFLMMLPLLAVLLLIGARVEPDGKAVGEEAKEEKQASRQNGVLKELFGNQRYVAYLVFAFGLNIYLGVTLVFMPYILAAANCNPSQIGIVVGFRALMEICSMIVGTRLSRKIATRYLMIVPGILFAVEHLLYAHAAGLAGILMLMAFSGLAGGLYYSLGPYYIYEIIDPKVANTAQAINAMDLTLVSIIGSAVGGIVIAKWGIHALTTGCGFLILALTILFSGCVFLRKTPKTKEVRV